ncbi:MAG: hypothetical protein ACQKBV_09865 [Puniceicoccales bacterium]
MKADMSKQGGIHEIENKRFVTKQSFADAGDFSLRYVDELIKGGVIPAVKLGRRCVRIPVPEAWTALMAYKTGGAQ